jgi:acyl carrier protein phosphodiesterase
MVGGFLGDHVKGVLRGERPAAVEDGIRLHRHIDATTSRDAAMQASARRFGAAHRRAAPILVDIIADHLLANTFADWQPVPLRHFTAGVYALLHAHRWLLPESADRLRQRLAATDGLAAYTGTSVVGRGFVHVAHRLRRPHDAAGWLRTFETGRDAFAADFADYYPRLLATAAAWRERVCLPPATWSQGMREEPADTPGHGPPPGAFTR